jgi:hypothetical protein
LVGGEALGHREQGVLDGLEVALGHARMQRQADPGRPDPVGVRQIEVPAAVALQPMQGRVKVGPGTDAVAGKSIDDGIAPDVQRHRAQHAVVLEVAAHAGRDALEPVEARKPGPVDEPPQPFGIVAAPGDGAVDVIELRQCDGGAHLVEFGVDTGGRVQRIGGDAMIALPAHAPQQVPIRRQHHAAFDPGQHLGGMHADGLCRGAAEHPQAVPLAAEAVAVVVQHPGPRGLRRPGDGGDIRRHAEDVHRDYPGDALGGLQQPLQGLRAEREGPRIDVAKHRRQPVTDHGVQRCDKGVGRQDDLAAR